MKHIPAFVHFAPLEKILHSLKKCSIRPDDNFDEVINLIRNKVRLMHYDFENSKKFRKLPHFDALLTTLRLEVSK